MEKVVMKLKKVNRYSYSLIIPKEFIAKYSWRERQKFVIKDKGGGAGNKRLEK
ncbi:MAG: hypothetical protein U9O20_00400 [Patescibacteria group bacterium]|nr:hypothetical protein [Patescibacteria group bacterium]